MKEIVVDLQKKLLMERMCIQSKTDNMLKWFSFNGRTMNYLIELPFHEARIVFMFRSRMFPTKANFPNRWSNSRKCSFCCNLDTDEHLFHCGGFVDLLEGSGTTFECFFKLEKIDTTKLSEAAKVLLNIFERLELANGDKDLYIQ